MRAKSQLADTSSTTKHTNISKFCRSSPCPPPQGLPIVPKVPSNPLVKEGKCGG